MMLLTMIASRLLLLLLTVTAALFSYARADQICCTGVGCFNDSSPYWPLPLPQCAEDQQLSMRVYTRHNPSAGQNISRSQIPPAFSGIRLTIFVIHGNTGLRLPAEELTWMDTMKNTLLEKDDYNVIIVQWNREKNRLYTQCVANTRTVGAEVGLVAANLLANGNSEKSRLYCVGHSLGAHVCGQAGMRTKFGRISGMDPAGPMYEVLPITAGLNPTAADLVDVIHTGGGPFHLGTLRRLGHIDFYPNGGKVQPNCVLEGGDVTNFPGDWTLGCSHIRAFLLFTESILTPRCNSRYTCTDEQNLPDSCTTDGTVVHSMGFNSDMYAARGIFYLETGGVLPYCNG